jgi:tRNA G10  N-methylase Trm11
MHYFILGSNPALSAAELLCVLGEANYEMPDSNILLFELSEDAVPAELIKRLGGTIKIGELAASLPGDSKPEMIKQAIFDIIVKIYKPGVKLNYGISIYGKINFDLKKSALQIKKDLRFKNISCRWVQAKEKALTSVQVEENRMTRDGVEIVLFKNKGILCIGTTKAVQPFKELSYRDYGRPGRDDHSGMLPPKLAQIMINLANAPLGGKILDPFCGSGTVLTEAALMGYENLHGSDISLKAIDDTRQNINWIKNKFNLSDFDFKVEKLSSTALSSKFQSNSIDAIITEPYLGPQRGEVEKGKVILELENLYSKSIKEFFKILKKGGRAVMIWPVLAARQKNTFLNPDTGGLTFIKPPITPNSFIQPANSKPGLTTRNTLLYGRPGQKVWREIVVLGK